jgi:hypothetical protein
MTANEARALRNMPAIDGGDELVTPLNVLVGGQAVPLHEPFSNGLQWPGDGADGAAEAANCNCSISIRMEDS